MNCFGDLPASWHPADRGTPFTVGCGGIKQDVGFRFRAGVCPVPDAINPQPILQPVETVEPIGHGFRPRPWASEGGEWINPLSVGQGCYWSLDGSSHSKAHVQSSWMDMALLDTPNRIASSSTDSTP